jgi:hypothetical protein
MSDGRNPARISIFRGGFGARFAPSKGKGRRVWPGTALKSRVRENTHVKMLKTKRLWTFQDGPKMPSFRQATNWRK